MAASFFSKRLLEQISLHAQFGVHSLKTTVFLFNGLHLAHHGCIHPAILRAPLAQHRRADPVPPAQIRHKSSNLSLAQQRHDLDFRKTAFIHRILLSHLAKKILHTEPLNHGGDYTTTGTETSGRIPSESRLCANPIVPPSSPTPSTSCNSHTILSNMAPKKDLDHPLSNQPNFRMQ